MEYIFRTVVAGAIGYFLNNLLKQVVFPEAPNGKILETMYKKYKIYKTLYYTFCLDFETGKLYSYDNEQELLLRRFRSFLEHSYAKNPEASELISSTLQKKIRNFIPHTSKTKFKRIQREINSEFYTVCRTLKLEFYHPKLSILAPSWIFYITSFLGIIFSLLSVVFTFLAVSAFFLCVAFAFGITAFITFFFFL